MVESGMPTCKMRIAETLPASVFSEKDLAKDHLPMHEVRTLNRYIAYMLSSKYNMYSTKRKMKMLIYQSKENQQVIYSKTYQISPQNSDRIAHVNKISYMMIA